jgi:hypothetical protein
MNTYADKRNASNDSRKRTEEAYGNYPATQENTHRRRLEYHPRYGTKNIIWKNEEHLHNNWET